MCNHLRRFEPIEHKEGGREVRVAAFCHIFPTILLDVPFEEEVAAVGENFWGPRLVILAKGRSMCACPRLASCKWKTWPQIHCTSRLGPDCHMQGPLQAGPLL